MKKGELKMDIKYYYNFTDEQMKKYGEILQPLMDKLYDMEKVDTLLKEKFKEWTDKNDELVSELDDYDLIQKGIEEAIYIFEEETEMELNRKEATYEISNNPFYPDYGIALMEEKNITTYDHYHISVIHHEAYSLNGDVCEIIRRLADSKYEVYDDLDLIMKYDLLESYMNGYGVSGDYLIDGAEEDEEGFKKEVEAMIGEVQGTTEQAKTLIEEVDKNFIKAKEDLDEVINEFVMDYQSIALGRLEAYYDIEVAV